MRKMYLTIVSKVIVQVDEGVDMETLQESLCVGAVNPQEFGVDVADFDIISIVVDDSK